MSILGIQGATSSGYTAPYAKRDNALGEDAYRNPATGPDRVSFSEDALRLAQRRTASAASTEESGGALKDKLPSDEVQSADAGSSSLTELGKTRLFSLLLESLFLAELEESAAGSGDAANGGNEQTSGEGAPRQQPRTAKAGNPLEDGERVAEIKKILTDFAKGKTELSDLPKVMAGAPAGGTGKGTSAVPHREGDSTARSGTEE